MMSDEKMVKVTNKQTGEVTLIERTSSAMRRKGEKPREPENPESRKVVQEDVNMAVPVSDGTEGKPDSTDKTPTKKNLSKKKSAREAIKNLADFISYAYERKGQNLRSLASGETKAITKNAKLSEKQFEYLVDMSERDTLLAVPRQIIFAVQEIYGQPLIRQEVRRFLSAVFKRHPVYLQNNLLPVIANIDGAIEPVEAVRVIAKLRPETLTSLSGLQQPRPKDIEALRSNAICCLALWLWESRGQPVNRVIRWLYDGYWSKFVPLDSNPTELLKLVTGIAEVPSVGAACAQFKAEADKSALRATTLERKIDSISDENEGLRKAVEDLQQTVRDRDNSIRGLSGQLAAERSAHADSKVHLGDDREHLRSSVVRRLNREVSLLTEGLQALRKEPPKVRVMEDHAERVLDGLQAAMKELEQED